MANQVRNFALCMATKVNVYQLLALGLALGAIIMGNPGGGGSGA
jgi:hypothetical protein